MNAPIRQAFIGAGSNLGDRLATLAAALERMRVHPAIVAVEQSSVLETDPVGYLDQPVFLNLVFGIETTLEPEGVMHSLLEIEQHLGRVRTVRWGPRTLDLDLLAFEGEARATPFLELPHPRMFERDFVVLPLRELLGRDRFRRSCWDELRAQLGFLASRDNHG